MAGKSTRKAGAESVEQKGVTTAIIVADLFGPELQPMSEMISPLLFPVCNVPVVEYMLDWLGTNGITHVIIAASECALQLRNYLTKSVWATPCTPYPLVIDILDCTGCTSYGSVLRRIQGKQEDLQLQGLFLLINGPVIANFDIRPAIEMHRSLLKQQKSDMYLATLIMRSAERALVDTVPSDSPQFVALADSRIVAYPEPYALNLWEQDNLPGSEHGTLTYTAKAATAPWVQLPLAELRESGHITVRPDLAPCHVIVVDSSWLNSAAGDNSDVDSFSHLVSTLLSSQLVHRFILHSYQIPLTSFSARVDSWRTYLYTNTAVLRRACYPYAPETNLLTAQGRITTFQRRYGHVLASESCTISTQATLGRSGTLVGTGVVIKDGAEVSGIIGSSSEIGEGSVIENCVLWPGCKVGSGVKLTNTVVCSIGLHMVGDEPLGRLETEIGDRVCLSESVICAGVRVPPDTTGEPRSYVGGIDAEELPVDGSPTVPIISRITSSGTQHVGFISFDDVHQSPEQTASHGLRRMTVTVSDSQLKGTADVGAVRDTNGSLSRSAWVAFSPASHITRSVTQASLDSVTHVADRAVQEYNVFDKGDAVLTRIFTRGVVQEQIPLQPMLTEIRSQCTALECTDTTEGFDLIADSLFTAIYTDPKAGPNSVNSVALLRRGLELCDGTLTLRALLAELYEPGKGLSMSKSTREEMEQALLESFKDITMRLNVSEEGATNLLRFLLLKDTKLISKRAAKSWAEDILEEAEGDDADERGAAIQFIEKTIAVLDENKLISREKLQELQAQSDHDDGSYYTYSSGNEYYTDEYYSYSD